MDGGWGIESNGTGGVKIIPFEPTKPDVKYIQLPLVKYTPEEIISSVKLGL